MSSTIIAHATIRPNSHTPCDVITFIEIQGQLHVSFSLFPKKNFEELKKNIFKLNALD